MGIKDLVVRTGNKAGNAIAKAACLSPGQIKEVQDKRNAYLTDMPDPNDSTATEMTRRLLAACGVEIHNAFLSRIDDAYVPVDPTAEYGEREFDAWYNVRYLSITKWVMDPDENMLEKLINVYDGLADEDCSIALVFNRTQYSTNVYLAVVNAENARSNVDVDIYCDRLESSLRGNFPGSEVKRGGPGRLPCLTASDKYSVAAISNIPTEKSEKFEAQTIEKLLDGNVPTKANEEYTIVLLATPVQDIEERKLRLAELYTALAPYAGWQTGFQYNQSDSIMSTATIGVNAGVSAGIQNGTNASVTNSDSTTDSTGSSVTDSTGNTVTDTTGKTKTKQRGKFRSKSGGISLTESIKFGGLGASATESYTQTAGTSTGTSTATTASQSVGETVGHAVAETLGKAVTSGVSKTAGVMKSANFGGNFGASFARSSSVTATIGKSESITQSFTNYTIKHALDILEKQMARLDQASALGMWDFAAYVLGENFGTVTNVAHTYLALTQGEESYVSQAAVNRWRGDLGDKSGEARTICTYLRDLRHPLFAINPALLDVDESFSVYPAMVTPTTALSGKELAYSLNFPNKSVPGLPVIECAEFGRNVVTFEGSTHEDNDLVLGKVFHMHREEPVEVRLNIQSLASHTFVTGSTGAGKTNTVCRILDEASEKGVRFLVIEPAKGEYKDVFGGKPDVSVFGTNASVAPLLRINPFSFPSQIHVLEHLDRLVEVFNVCWPMYAAMPAVLKDAIERSYVDCGWDLTESKNPYGKDLFPTMADAARNVRDILDESDYDADNKGAYKGSLLTRLNSLTNGINGLILSSDEIDSATLFNTNVIVDLSRVGSMETKSLLMGLLVLKLQEYRMATATGANLPLRHLTVLEEAHNLLKRTSTDQPVEGGNLLGKSVEMLANAIAEMRTHGEGFIIADQAPGLLDMAAIRNTNTKIILRLPDLTDRELVGKAASLNDNQIVELARLPMGVAAIYQNNWIQPVLCKVAKATDGRPLEYVRQKSPLITSDPADVLLIAEVLSRGEKISSGARLDEIRTAMDRAGISAYAKASVLRSIVNPPVEPRMTKLGPVMSALFPSVREAVVRSRRESAYDPEAWTKSAAEELANTVRVIVADQVRRDIIQAIITDLVYNEQRDIQALQDWTQRGELR